MKLRIYNDEFLGTVQEERVVDELKIPYRTADAVLDALSDIDLEKVDEYKILSVALKNKHHITTIVRATFGLSEEELGRVNILEMGALAKEIIRYVMGQVAQLNQGENDQTPRRRPRRRPDACAALARPETANLQCIPGTGPHPHHGLSPGGCAGPDTATPGLQQAPPDPGPEGTRWEQQTPESDPP